MTAQELKATLLLWMGIEEATAKTKSGLTSPSLLGRSDIVELSSYLLNELESLDNSVFFKAVNKVLNGKIAEQMGKRP
jgi:hypothetical protein